MFFGLIIGVIMGDFVWIDMEWKLHRSIMMNEAIDALESSGTEKMKEVYDICEIITHTYYCHHSLRCDILRL